jgi:hypothetical protein
MLNITITFSRSVKTKKLVSLDSERRKILLATQKYSAEHLSCFPLMIELIHAVTPL